MALELQYITQFVGAALRGRPLDLSLSHGKGSGHGMTPLQWRSVLQMLSLSVLVSLLALHTFQAQQQAPSATAAIDKIALHQALLDLTNPWTVMCVAAHPDDEDGATLTVLRRKYGVHTVSLFSTNGEGGQNAVGPELYEELGVIRIQETMAAAQIQGSEAYFLGLKDFGYSKSAQETFRVWGHDEALGRMVQKIRELRPDVIITNHDTTRGHGHHQATGQLVLEAFDAAGDPQRFPEQLNKVKPWQPKRLFVRVFSRVETIPATERLVMINPNEIDPVRGTSFAEQSLVALQQHATQGPWPKNIEEWLRARKDTSGKLPLLRYRLVREADKALQLPNNSHNFLDGLRLPEEIAKQLQPPTIEARPLTEFLDQPERILEALRTARARGWLLNNRPEEFALRFLMIDLRREYALAAASGITAEVVPRDSASVISENPRLLLVIGNAGNHTVEVVDATFRLASQKDWTAQTPLLLRPHTSAAVPINGNSVGPVVTSISSGLNRSDPQLLRDRYQAELRVMLDDTFEFLRIPVATKVKFVPAVEIANVAPSPLVMTPATVGKPMDFRLRLINHLTTPVEITLSAMVEHQGNCSSDLCPDVTLANKSVMLAAQETEVAITAPMKKEYGREELSRGQVGVIQAPYHLYFQGQGQISTKAWGGGNGVRGISFRNQHQTVSYIDARVVPNLRVGYVRTFDYSLPSALRSLGVTAEELTVGDVLKRDFKVFDTIIIDNRGYEAHPELVAANPRLMQFVQDGGTLIVFYHKDNEWNPAPDRHRPQLAPYSIILADDRVTDENAPIEFLEPQHPLLSYPNRIDLNDFTNWIQERGLYYPKAWDSHYTALFSTNDPGEARLTGGLLVTKYGRGNYLYTSMVWYRQLRAGVPGAYRMFANMVSYGHVPLQTRAPQTNKTELN